MLGNVEAVCAGGGRPFQSPSGSAGPASVRLSIGVECWSIASSATIRLLEDESLPWSSTSCAWRASSLINAGATPSRRSMSPWASSGSGLFVVQLHEAPSGLGVGQRDLDGLIDSSWTRRERGLQHLDLVRGQHEQHVSVIMPSISFSSWKSSALCAPPGNWRSIAMRSTSSITIVAGCSDRAMVPA